MCISRYVNTIAGCMTSNLENYVYLFLSVWLLSLFTNYQSSALFNQQCRVNFKISLWKSVWFGNWNFIREQRTNTVFQLQFFSDCPFVSMQFETLISTIRDDGPMWWELVFFCFERKTWQKMYIFLVSRWLTDDNLNLHKHFPFEMIDFFCSNKMWKQDEILINIVCRWCMSRRLWLDKKCQFNISIVHEFGIFVFFFICLKVNHFFFTFTRWKMYANSSVLVRRRFLAAAFPEVPFLLPTSHF